MKSFPILKLLEESYHNLPAKEKRLSLVLFVATFISATLTIALSVGAENQSWRQALSNGLFFSVPLMLILTAHELGHYLNAYAYGVASTPPYFIPLPLLSPIGTMGAFIRMRSAVPNQCALFDIAFWGPAMSFILSLPFFIIGLLLSDTAAITPDSTFLSFGDSLLTHFLTNVFFPQLPAEHEIIIHPMGFAGWTGLLVTAINLLPLGQLDGGHIAYALFGKRQRQLAYLVLAVVSLLAFFYSGWILWIFIFFAMGVSHPPLHENDRGNFVLDNKRKKWGYISLLVFILTFVPAPINIGGEEQGLQERAPAQEWFSEEDNLWKIFYRPQDLSLHFSPAFFQGVLRKFSCQKFFQKADFCLDSKHNI